MILLELLIFLVAIYWPVWLVMPLERSLNHDGSKLVKLSNKILKKTTFCSFNNRGKDNTAWSTLRKNRLISGFFNHPMDTKTFSHPKDAEENELVDDAATVNDIETTMIVTDYETTMTTINPKQIVFDEEHECVSANDGRPCLCFMTDFLERLSTTKDVSSFKCQSYKAVPLAFVIIPRPMEKGGNDNDDDDDDDNNDDNDDNDDDSNNDNDDPNTNTVAATAHVVAEQESPNENGVRNVNERASSEGPKRKRVNFNEVINYHLDQNFKNDHYAVQYGLVGNDVEVQCLINGDGGKTYTAYTWNYIKRKRKSNTTITGEHMSNLMILRLEPAASKNYTCVPATGNIEHLIKDSSYKHYVIAVDTPKYVIRGKVAYTSDGDCEPEIINPVKKQWPNLVKTNLCPEGRGTRSSSRYACNVRIKTPTCTEDKKRMEIYYFITLNNNSKYLNLLKTCKNALRYQKLLAKISSVLVENMNKTLAVQITSKISTIDMHFKPDWPTTAGTYVTCGPGFGIREVFCSACSPHHYSPDGSAECLKCRKGYHQPVAGSAKCVKCPSFFVPGCDMKEVTSPSFLYFTLFICVLVIVSIIVSCVCCCREENEKNIKILPRNIRKKFKRTKEYSTLLTTDQGDRENKSSKTPHKTRKLKKLMFNKNAKQLFTKSNTSSSNVVHEKYKRETGPPNRKIKKIQQRQRQRKKKP